jgi:hypothetical protein
MKKTILNLITAYLLCCTVSIYAQENTSKKPNGRWYQIEILIFSHALANNDEKEIWSKNLGLKYPKNIVELKNTSQGEQPFTLLNSNQHSFNSIKKRLVNTRGFRQLFHRAWRQPIGKRNNSESILIRGGNQFDNHYELEGSIKLGLERYLHITTDLWLSTFVNKAEQGDRQWPILPRVPIHSSATQISNIDPNTSVDYSADNLLSITKDEAENMSSSENPFLDLGSNNYAVNQTIALRQSRRMRSNELHYIDHPLMGVLVKITRYSR